MEDQLRQVILFVEKFSTGIKSRTFDTIVANCRRRVVKAPKFDRKYLCCNGNEKTHGEWIGLASLDYVFRFKSFMRAFRLLIVSKQCVKFARAGHPFYLCWALFDIQRLNMFMRKWRNTKSSFPNVTKLQYYHLRYRSFHRSYYSINDNCDANSGPVQKNLMQIQGRYDANLGPVSKYDANLGPVSIQK